MPKIIVVLFKLENVQYATSLDLNQVYYYIRLIKHASNLRTIILPQGISLKASNNGSC